jgi:hypothetical protein
MSSKIVDIFRVEDRLCVVVARHMMAIDGFHCGYVEVNTVKDYDNYDIDIEELTFGGQMTGWDVDGMVDGIKNVEFVGFDSAHLQDTPETSCFEAVKFRTIELAEELIKKGY